MSSFVTLDRLLAPDRPPRRTPRTVAVLTPGCKLNQADSEAMARELRRAGCTVIDRPATADAYIINSCSVAHIADGETPHLIRLARLAPVSPPGGNGARLWEGPTDIHVRVRTRSRAELRNRLLPVRLVADDDER